MKVFQSLARCLAEGPFGPMFGLVGDANLFLVDSYVREYNGRYIAAANEGGSVLMALGYATASGKVGLATVTQGPAVTNTLTGLAEGCKSSTPMVLLCGDTAPEDWENNQNISQRDAIVATGAGFEQLHTAQTAVSDFARAVRRAYAERRPIAFNMPADILRSEAKETTRNLLLSLSPPSIVPGGDGIEDAVGVIAAAKRPIVLAGRGACDGASRAALLRLAERIDAALATTLRAKDLFRSEKYNLGICGTLSSPSAVETILKSDCIIAFGASLHRFTTSRGTFMEGKRVIQVVAREGDIGKAYAPRIGLVGTAPEVVDKVIHWLDTAEIKPSGFRNELQPDQLAAFPPGGASPSGMLDYVDTLHRLNKLLPADRVLVTDGGRNMLKAMQLLDVAGPDDFLFTCNFGSIGLSMSHGIGVALARPERPVVVAMGDGGFMLGGLTEFNTAVRYGLKIIVVIFNDGSYGAEHVQLRNRQMDPAVSLFDWPDFAPVARALGGAGHTVRNHADLSGIPRAIAEANGPLLIDIKLSPDEMSYW